MLVPSPWVPRWCHRVLRGCQRPPPAAEALITPPPPVPVTGVEEVGTIVEASSTQAVMGASDTAGPGGVDMVVVMVVGLAAPLSSESRDIVIPWVPGATQMAVVTSSLPAVRVRGPLQQRKLRAVPQPRRWQRPLRTKSPSPPRR
jgi:hypothetical protein